MRPVDAGGDASPDAPAGDGGFDAADPNALCAARTPATTSPGTVADLMGTAPAYTSGAANWPELALGTIVDGHATHRGSGSLLIQLTDYVGGCGMSKKGIHKIGGKSLQLYLWSPPITAGSYTGGLYVATRYAAAPGTSEGACTASSPADGMTLTATPTVTITDIVDGSHVAGSFALVYQGQALSGTFNVPFFCDTDTGLDPAACCVP